MPMLRIAATEDDDGCPKYASDFNDSTKGFRMHRSYKMLVVVITDSKNLKLGKNPLKFKLL